MGLLPFPLAYQKMSVSVTLYTYQSEKLTYPADECASTMYRGFGGLEGNFCWSNSEEASVRCMLRQQDYTMTLQMGCMLDLNRLGFAQYPVTIEINGKSAGTVTVMSPTTDNPSRWIFRQRVWRTGRTSLPSAATCGRQRKSRRVTRGCWASRWNPSYSHRRMRTPQERNQLL